MGRLRGYLGLVVVFCSLAGCNARTVKMITGFVGPNREAELADEEGKRKGRTKTERQVDEIVAENQRQLEEVQAFVNQQLNVGQDAVRAVTPRMGKSTRRSESPRNGGINSNPYLDD